MCSNRMQYLENNNIIVVGATLWSKIYRDHGYTNNGILEVKTKETHNRGSGWDLAFIEVNVRDARRKFPTAKALLCTHRKRDSISLLVLIWRWVE